MFPYARGYPLSYDEAPETDRTPAPPPRPAPPPVASGPFVKIGETGAEKLLEGWEEVFKNYAKKAAQK